MCDRVQSSSLLAEQNHMNDCHTLGMRPPCRLSNRAVCSQREPRRWDNLMAGPVEPDVNPQNTERRTTTHTAATQLPRLNKLLHILSASSLPQSNKWSFRFRLNLSFGTSETLFTTSQMKCDIFAFLPSGQLFWPSTLKQIYCTLSEVEK